MNSHRFQGTIVLATLVCLLTAGPLSCPRECVDADGDGYGDPASIACTYPGLDCDDLDPDVHPGTQEGEIGRAACFDGIDNDCDGRTDWKDSSCDVWKTFGLKYRIPGHTNGYWTQLDNDRWLVAAVTDDTVQDPPYVMLFEVNRYGQIVWSESIILPSRIRHKDDDYSISALVYENGIYAIVQPEKPYDKSNDIFLFWHVSLQGETTSLKLVTLYRVAGWFAQLSSIQVTESGNLLIGSYKRLQSDDCRPFLLELTPSCNVVWSYFYEPEEKQTCYPFSVVSAKNGYFVTSARMLQDWHVSYNSCASRIDSSGTVKWHSCYDQEPVSDPDWEYFTWTTLANDRFLAYEVFNREEESATIFKVDGDTGDLVWEQVRGIANYKIGLITCNDTEDSTSIYCTGWSDKFPQAIWLTEFAGNGIIREQRLLWGTASLTAGSELLSAYPFPLENGDVALTSVVKYDDQDCDTWLTMLDSELDVKWSQLYGKLGRKESFAFYEFAGNKLLLGADFTSEETNFDVFWLGDEGTLTRGVTIYPPDGISYDAWASGLGTMSDGKVLALGKFHDSGSPGYDNFHMAVLEEGADADCILSPITLGTPEVVMEEEFTTTRVARRVKKDYTMDRIELPVIVEDPMLIHYEGPVVLPLCD